MVTEGRLRSVTRAVDSHGFRAIHVDLAEVLGLAERDRALGDER